MSSVSRGLFWGFIGVAAFSITLPATRASAPYLGVAFVALGRAIVAGVLAALILAATRQPVPSRADLITLCGVSAGVVFGFPLLTTWAMTMVPATHGAVVVGLLPLTTAVFGTLVTGERPSLGFWLTSLAGTAVLLAFILESGGGGIGLGDVALVGGVICAAFGYALGGKLAGRLGGWQVICWALVVSVPALVVVSPFFVTWPASAAPVSAWAGFIYVSVISQLVGFFAWYHGLAVGGVARVSQVQLLQLFMTLAASAVLLGEPLSARTLGYAAAVVAIVAIASRLRVKAAPSTAAETATPPRERGGATS